MKLLVEVHNMRYEYRLVVSVPVAPYEENFDDREGRQAHDCPTCGQQSHSGGSC